MTNPKDFRVETVSPTGIIINGQPILDEKTANALAEDSNKHYGKDGFRSVVKRGPVSKPVPGQALN